MFTGHKAWKMFNTLNPKVQIKNPQMIYNYIATGKIPTKVVGDQKLISKVDFDEWSAKFIAKRLAKLEIEI